MDEWVTILKETAQGNFEEPWDAKALHLELPRLEAVALASLCSIEADVRRAAMDALAAAKRLHQALIIVVRGAPATSPAGLPLPFHQSSPSLPPPPPLFPSCR